MISVQFGQAQLINKDQYITSAEWKLPGSPQPTRYNGQADFFIKSDFISLRMTVAVRELFRFKTTDLINVKSNAKPNHFTINLNGNGYIKLGSDKSLKTIAELLKGA